MEKFHATIEEGFLLQKTTQAVEVGIVRTLDENRKQVVLLRVPAAQESELPRVSLVTVLDNKQDVVVFLDNWSRMDYPKNKCEVVAFLAEEVREQVEEWQRASPGTHLLTICDDGTETAGKKFGLLSTAATSDYIVHFDASTYVPSESVRVRVLALQKNEAGVCGSTVIGICSGKQKEVRHASAKRGYIFEETLAYTKEVAETCRFCDSDNNYANNFIEAFEGKYFDIPWAYIALTITNREFEDAAPKGDLKLLIKAKKLTKLKASTSSYTEPRGVV